MLGGSGCWILDARCWILDARCWMLDARWPPSGLIGRHISRSARHCEATTRGLALASTLPKQAKPAGSKLLPSLSLLRQAENYCKGRSCRLPRNDVHSAKHSTVSNLKAAIKHPASNIQHPASSIQHPASSIQYPETSSIQYPASRLTFAAFQRRAITARNGYNLLT
jgi:hypothetical protein